MDVSKLPRLSDSSDATPNADSATQIPVSPVAASQPLIGPPLNYGVAPVALVTPNPADAWLSIAVGVIILFLNPRLFEYLFARSTFSWTFNDAQGSPLAYGQTVFFWGDVALTLFALVFIVDGIVFGFMRASRLLLIGALLLTALATLLNLGYVVYMLNGYGFQIWSGLAVAFGVYIAISQLGQLRVMGPQQPIS